MPTTPPIKRIVVGVEGSEHAAWALEFAIGMARAEKAEIVAVFAVAPATDVVYGGSVVSGLSCPVSTPTGGGR